MTFLSPLPPPPPVHVQAKDTLPSPIVVHVVGGVTLPIVVFIRHSSTPYGQEGVPFPAPLCVERPLVVHVVDGDRGRHDGEGPAGGHLAPRQAFDQRAL
eukprot:CAMPEP_0195636102 /NCGR_PEP_ID=MMETSP0815-20121206/23674_1 /TAXON_ID=97485 /ORGANISM="Prymnesium parvum, Strain Texoma1" /LENGTH=98 /DNA_ID=CAMNT_0040778157 /DNA_START=147 /DNA_END=440 /DNA_ORIENTATION=+